MSATTYTTKRLDHLGLVTGFCNEIGLVDVINDVLGVSSRQKVSYGQLFVSMLLNGLGFTGRTLHMYSEYFQDKPVERLLGKGVTPEQINDDSLGRCLDRLYEVGVSSLYEQIAQKVVQHLRLPCKGLHLDSSSFHYDGQGNANNDDPNVLQITRGYSRDHRPDLNQVVLNLICENSAGIPVYMKPASGNSNDMAGFREIVKAHVSSLKAAHQNRYLVADAALYTAETIKTLDENKQLFITRVPQTLSEAKSLVTLAGSHSFESMGNGYQGVWVTSQYGGIEQRWLLVHSEQATKREQHTLNGRMLKAAEKSRKAFKKLCQKEFACMDDALAAVEQYRAEQATIDVIAQVNEVPVYKTVGRPAAEQVPERVYFQIEGSLYTPLSRREQELKQIGLFILATNDLSSTLTMAELLKTYKAQQAVEKGFRFLKSPDFLTSAFYLKKPERIEALLMVMTTCLMVYSALEYKIRHELEQQDKHFPDMKKKPTQRPTARWVFQCFAGIDLLTINEQQTLLLNIQDRQSVIIDCLGDVYRKVYS